MYSLYGLRIRSAIRLPCPQWRASDQAADVELVEATEQEILDACDAATTYDESDGFWECRRFANGAMRNSWKDHFDFLVTANGSRVLWRRLAEVPDEVLFTYLLNQVLSECLVARGVEPFHASGIVVDGAAIAILGDSGYGKSTLAAALMGRGCRLLSDDALVLKFSGGQVLAYPSLARLKLHPDSADAVFAQRRALPMNTFTDKMILPLGDSEHSAQPVPLRAIFVIPSAAGAARISIRGARGRRALLALIRSPFTLIHHDQRRLEAQLRFASRLAQAVPVKFLSYPRRLELLPEVAASILADLAKKAKH